MSVESASAIKAGSSTSATLPIPSVSSSPIASTDIISSPLQHVYSNISIKPSAVPVNVTSSSEPCLDDKAFLTAAFIPSLV